MSISTIQIIVCWRSFYMKINSSYPYPVLCEHNDDYVDSTFSADITVEEKFGELIVQAKYTLTNTEMKRLIENGDAVYTLHMECPQTSYRNQFETRKGSLEVTIPIDQLRGKIDIHSFVIVKNKLKDYTNASLNDWFKHIPLTLEKGNLLAIGTAMEATIFEDNLELLNIPSIVKVAQSYENDYMEVDMNSDFITISLPKYEYEQYALNAKSTLQQTILSTVIVPSLVYVFSMIHENGEDLQEYTWYQVLGKILEENGENIEDVGTDTLPALKAVQKVLRKPLKGSFEEIEKLSNMGD